jgi:hypothetical protein
MKQNPLTLPQPFFWLGGLKYEILAFIRTKNVEKIKITSRKRHRTASCQNKAVEV